MKILIMIYWSFFIILLLIGSNPVNADQVADKAEFKKLYAEFSDLFANSEAIEPIIEIAEKLYSLSPLAYGKNSNNTAVVTYNLATLYDEKGGETNSEDEKRASELYKEYFTILDGQKKPLDNQYFQQYIAFVKSEHNAFGYRSDTSYSKKAIEIAKSINLSNLERANLDFLIANHRYYSGKPTDAKKLFTNAHKKYIAEYGLNHYKVGETTFWLAQIDFKNGRHKRAGENYLSAMEILSKSELESAAAMVLITHAALVEIYAKRGDDAEATKHCLEYAYKRPKEFERNIVPLYKIPAKFPDAARRKSGQSSVTLEYDIDKNGYTTNIVVRDATIRKIENAAINALKEFRYAPNIRDGKPVAIEGLEMRFSFGHMK